MIGRRTAVGLSLLCALLFSAIAVQSASAAKAVNTTGFTCVKGAGLEDFSDPHCDENVGAGKGEYGHQAIPNDTPIEVTTTNVLTGGATDPGVLLGKAFGAATEITCNKAHGEGTGEQTEIVATKQHTGSGKGTTKITECSVQKPAKCDIKEPIEFSPTGEALEELGPEKNEMGGEVKPPEGSKVFVQITYINNGAEKCSLNEKTVNVEGSGIVTGIVSPTAKHTGATADYDHERLTAAKTLLFGGVPAGIEITTTVTAKNGSPLAATTIT